MFLIWEFVILTLKNVKTFILFHFAVSKRSITNNYGTKYPILIDIVSSIIAFWLSFTSIIVLSLCGFYKMIVYVYLMLRYASHFCGMITGMDMLTILAPGCDGAVHGLINISTDQAFNGQEVYRQLCEQVNEKFFLNKVDVKFFSTREYTSLGYHYFKKCFNIEVEDVVKFIKAPQRNESEFISENELLTLAKSYYNSDLPLGNKFNWDICLCLNPVLSNNKEGKTSFAILTRMHHTLGDGLVIYNILANNFFKFGPEFKEYAENLVNKCGNKKRKGSPKHVYKFGYKIPVEKPCILRDGSTHKNTLFANRVETPSSVSYMYKMKCIRDKFPELLTTNILLTAYSASLAEYYLKYSKLKDIPENLSTSHPIQRDIFRYLNIYSASDEIKLKNDVSHFILDIPIIPRVKRRIPIEEYLIQRMLDIKREFNRAISSLDIDCNIIWTIFYYGVIPNQLVRKLLEGNFILTLTTCMPGGPKIKLFNNDFVDNITFFLPRQCHTTLMLAINTYDQRLQIALTADEDKVRTLTNLNEILDGVFKYLDLLYEQCMTL